MAHDVQHVPWMRPYGFGQVGPAVFAKPFNVDTSPGVRRCQNAFEMSSRSRRVSSAGRSAGRALTPRSEEHTSELQSQSNLVCRLLLEKKKIQRERRCIV